jgi:hypothetical protein
MRSKKSIPELHERPPLDRDIKLTDIPQAKIDQLLVLLLAQPPNETRARQLLAQSVCSQAVLSEAEIEERGHGYGGRAELFLLLDEVGAADEADGAFVAEGGEQLEHGGGNVLGGALVGFAGAWGGVGVERWGRRGDVHDGRA